MDKAVMGYCRMGYFRMGMLQDSWDDIMRIAEGLGGASLQVTRKRLMLMGRDAITGWYDKAYEDSIIDALILDKSTNRIALACGTYVRTDALAITCDPLVEGDQIIVNGEYCEVEAVRNHYLGNSFTNRDADLTLLPFKNLMGAGYTESSVDDARHRHKVYLEGHLDDTKLPNYIIAYGEPDYSLVRVFREKGVDLVFSIGEETSDTIIDSDHYPIGYQEHIPATILCIDKDNIEGTKLMWQAETELRRVAETYPEGSLRALSERRPETKRLGSTILYSAAYMFDYTRDTT